MPIYEYHCFEFQKEFEIMRPVSKGGNATLFPSFGTEGEKLVSACVSRVGFYVRPSAKAALRRPGPPGSNGEEEATECQS